MILIALRRLRLWHMEQEQAMVTEDAVRVISNRRPTDQRYFVKGTLPHPHCQGFQERLGSFNRPSGSSILSDERWFRCAWSDLAAFRA